MVGRFLICAASVLGRKEHLSELPSQLPHPPRINIFLTLLLATIAATHNGAVEIASNSQ